MTPFDFQLPTRLVFGAGAIDRIGELASDRGFRRPLVVSDRGLEEAGHVDRALGLLRKAGMKCEVFDDFDINPDAAMVDRGVAFAAGRDFDSVIGLGGGSSLDCAKAINLLLTNGGEMADYRGYGHARRPLLPMLAVPTTAGTGSEAQSYAVIADSETHMKMACGDPKLAFAVAILDPELTYSQPPAVTAAAGFDAIAHAVETAVTRRRSAISTLFSREAFRLLDGHYQRVLDEPRDLAARSAMQLGAYYAGIAIEQSMLGAAHACANPLTARYDLTHGVALAILLPHVVRWNAQGGPGSGLYGDLVGLAASAAEEDAGEYLAARLAAIGRSSGFPADLRTAGVPAGDLSALAEAAGEQWTGTFNPRPFGSREALEVYRCAY
ncbi:MAG: iron-containing alcohol dehydrogenase [Acidobacteria bacterium]|nr:iron-containing alcohol dehydrogenase [Acidobacteriota bacterium]